MKFHQMKTLLTHFSPLILLLFAFLFKGLVFAALIPMHQGSDEYVHYATMQYLAEPAEKTWARSEEQQTANNTKDIANFHYTEEIRAFARLTHSQEFSGAPYNTQDLSPETVASVETEMRSGAYPPHIAFTTPVIVSGGDLAHRIGSWVERALVHQDTFTRYAAARSLAIVYGLIIVSCAYFIALWSGLRRDHALLIAGLVAFHPQLTATTSIINYDPLLIAAWSVVLLGATSVLRHGLNHWNTLTMLCFTWIAMSAKGIGGILWFLVAAVICYGLRERFTVIKHFQIWKIGLIGIALCTLIFLAAPKQYTSILTNIPTESHGKSAWKSFTSYLSDGVFDSGKINRTATTYWGTFGWLDTSLHHEVVKTIQYIEYLSILGLFILLCFFLRNTLPAQYLHSLVTRLQHICPLNRFTRFLGGWKLRSQHFFHTVIWHEKSFLPQRNYILLFIISTLLLRGGVHFYDWYGRYAYGEGVGLPGRYFLPNIIPHIILVTTGLGMLCKHERAYTVLLKILFAGMTLLLGYAILWIIIPRYYL